MVWLSYPGVTDFPMFRYLWCVCYVWCVYKMFVVVEVIYGILFMG